MRRFRTVPGDFDARALQLADPIPDHWEDNVKAQALANREQIRAQLHRQFGAMDAERKLRDFIEIGAKPFSVVAYHNRFFEQTRTAFVQGAYYPALLSACALGERTLNHLVLDLRDDFKGAVLHDKVARARSLTNWRLMIEALSKWGVLAPSVAELFRTLSRVRNRAIHFNPATYASVRDDALAAVTGMRDIIEQQFGAFGRQRWFIEGTRGACFIKKAYETDPFVKRFLAPRAMYVGPLHAVTLTPEFTWQFVDWPPELYGSGTMTDEQYRDLFNDHDPASVVPTDGPHTPATIRGPDDVAPTPTDKLE